METMSSVGKRPGSERGNHLIRNSWPYKDLILIVGQNAVGKTTTFNVLAKEAEARTINYASRPISDLFYLLKEVQEDDTTGGFSHYHEWCKTETGHNHEHGEPNIPFTVKDDILIKNMFSHFFHDLSCLPKTGILRFAEWTGGVNTNRPPEPASCIDLSFTRVEDMFRKKNLSTDWLHRVLAVIHPRADTSIRYMLNARRNSYQLQEVATGKVSPQKTITNLDIFGEDDFHRIKHFFTESGISDDCIYTVDNQGNEDFFIKLADIANRIFPAMQTKQVPPSQLAEQTQAPDNLMLPETEYARLVTR